MGGREEGRKGEREGGEKGKSWHTNEIFTSQRDLRVVNFVLCENSLEDPLVDVRWGVR